MSQEIKCPKIKMDKVFLEAVQKQLPSSFIRKYDEKENTDLINSNEEVIFIGGYLNPSKINDTELMDYLINSCEDIMEVRDISDTFDSFIESMDMPPELIFLYWQKN